MYPIQPKAAEWYRKFFLLEAGTKSRLALYRRWAQGQTGGWRKQYKKGGITQTRIWRETPYTIGARSIDDLPGKYIGDTRPIQTYALIYSLPGGYWADTSQVDAIFASVSILRTPKRALAVPVTFHKLSGIAYMHTRKVFEFTERESALLHRGSTVDPRWVRERNFDEYQPMGVVDENTPLEVITFHHTSTCGNDNLRYCENEVFLDSAPEDFYNSTPDQLVRFLEDNESLIQRKGIKVHFDSAALRALEEAHSIASMMAADIRQEYEEAVAAGEKWLTTDGFIYRDRIAELESAAQRRKAQRP